MSIDHREQRGDRETAGLGRKVARAAAHPVASAGSLARVAEAWAELVATGAVLRGPSSRLTARLAGALVEPEAAPAETAAVPERDSAAERSRPVVRALRRAARFYPGPALCLHRSLALHRLLVRRGVPAVMRIGVRPGAPVDAHAWVEVGGHVVGDSERVRAEFTVLPSLEPHVLAALSRDDGR